MRKCGLEKEAEELCISRQRNRRNRRAGQWNSKEERVSKRKEGASVKLHRQAAKKRKVKSSVGVASRLVLSWPRPLFAGGEWKIPLLWGRLLFKEL